MPRLPIIGRCGQVLPVLLAIALTAPASATAQPTPNQPSVETLMYHMTDHSDVQKARRMYRSSVQTAMLYSQCPAEYKVTDEKRQSMDRMLYRDELTLRKAFELAHQQLTTKLPGEGVNKAVDTYIADYRNDEALELGKLIKLRKAGCKQTALERLDNAYLERQFMEAHAAAQAAAAEEKRRQEAPAVVESEQQNKQSH